MNKEKIKIYQCGYGKVTLVESDGLVMVNATQMARPYGDKKRTSCWLDNKSTQEFISKATKSKKLNGKQLVMREGRRVTWMYETLAIEYAKWLSPETMDFAYWIMRIIEDFSTLAQREEEKKPQKPCCSLSKPKPDYEPEPTYTVSQIAVEFGMSAMELNDWLRINYIQYKRANQWHLHRPYRDKGYVQTVSLYQKGEDGQCNTFKHTQWTEKGREFIRELMDKHKQEAIPTEEVPNIEEKKKDDIVLNIDPPTYEELEEIISTYADMTDSLRRENKELQRRIQEMEKQLAKYKQMVTTFRDVALSVISTMGKDEPPFIVPKIPVESSTYEAIGV